ncbi:MAG: RnfABCDGE type electron transport complex subunit B [Candidatus Altiarchaeota archaeon]
MADAVIYSVAVLGGMALASAVMLIYFSKKFAVASDPRIDAILAVLPGMDCGACGMAGCKAFANALVNDNAPINGCVAANPDAIKKISSILGKDAELREKKVAKLMCSGGAKLKGFRYDGIPACNAANLVVGDYRSCRFGCLGFGDCVRVCPFGAIRMENNLPAIDESKCTGCGLCVQECPKKLFKLIKSSAKVYVKCMSTETAERVCQLGCISCRICEKACPAKAITIADNLARIDYSKCINCGICAKKCPRKIIAFKD